MWFQTNSIGIRAVLCNTCRLSRNRNRWGDIYMRPALPLCTAQQHSVFAMHIYFVVYLHFDSEDNHCYRRICGMRRIYLYIKYINLSIVISCCRKIYISWWFFDGFDLTCLLDFAPPHWCVCYGWYIWLWLNEELRLFEWHRYSMYSCDGNYFSHFSVSEWHGNMAGKFFAGCCCEVNQSMRFVSLSDIDNVESIKLFSVPK